MIEFWPSTKKEALTTRTFGPRGCFGLSKAQTGADYGCGVGEVNESRIKAVSELRERLYLRYGVSQEGHVDLGSSDMAAFREAFGQINGLGGRSLITATVAGVQAVKLSDMRNCLIPRCCISLNNDADRHIQPIADSAGTACHYVYQSAEMNALLEFCERQSVFRSWVSGSPGLNRVDLKDLRWEQELHRVIYDRLIQDGTLMAFSVRSLFNSFTVIVVWFGTVLSRGRRLHGASACRFGVRDALGAALLELWASVNLFIGLGFAEDPELITEIGIWLDSAEEPACRCDMGRDYNDHLNDYHTFFSSFVRSYDDIFLYHRLVHTREGPMHIAKVASPSFFLQTHSAKDCNASNRYNQEGLSRRLAISYPF